MLFLTRTLMLFMPLTIPATAAQLLAGSILIKTVRKSSFLRITAQLALDFLNMPATTNSSWYGVLHRTQQQAKTVAEVLTLAWQRWATSIKTTNGKSCSHWPLNRQGGMYMSGMVWWAAIILAPRS